MRMLQIVANYPPIPGGSGTYAQNLSLELSKNDIDVVILTFKPRDINISKNDNILDVRRVKAFNIESIEYPIFYPTILYDIHKIVKEMHIDIINSHTRFFTSSYWASLYKKLNKEVGFVHTEHGAGPLVHRYNFISSFCDMYDYTFGKWAIKTADIPIAIGPSSEKFLRQLGCEKDINIIPNSINCSEFETSIKNDYEKDNKVTITYIGRLVESKGVSDLIRVFSEIEKIYDVKLYIVGTGPDEYYFKKIAESLNVKNIYFLGFRKDISDILSMTDIFVNPSYYDSAPTTVLEAGCLGIRIISTNVGDVPYILGDSYQYIYSAGSLDKLKDHIISIILKSDFRDNTLKDRIHKLFDWKVNADKYLDTLFLRLK